MLEVTGNWALKGGADPVGSSAQDTEVASGRRVFCTPPLAERQSLAVQATAEFQLAHPDQ